MKFFIIYLLPILFDLITSSEIIYEFNRDFELNKGMSDEQIYSKLAFNDLYTHVKVGSPEKELKVGINFKYKSLALLGSKIKNRDIFDETSSSSYKSISSAFTYDNQILSANISEEYIYLNTINKKEKINFILITDLDEESLENNSYEPIYFSGYLGLAIHSEFQGDYPESLPIYLNENYKSNYNSAFSIKFNIKDPGNYKGKITMNGYPHEYDENNYHLEQYKTTRIQSINNFHDWCISIDNAYYGNSSITQNNYIIFRIEIGIILAPNEFMKYITDNYFTKYSDKCEYKKFKLTSQDYNYYVCNKNIDIKKFENVSFELKENNFNFSLSYQNLFYEYNNKYYFLIASGPSNLHDFIIGSVLMKNYDFVFDKFKSNIGFYDFSIEVKTKNYFIIYIVVIGVLPILIILVIIYLIWKYCNKPRISRKNELDDEYNYISGSITDDKKISSE